MTGSTEARTRLLPFLLLLFVGSGSAALIYEIVWFQMLQLVIGSTGVSLGVLLGSFMGGMFLGSLAFARFVPATHHPLRVYAALELGIAGFALLLLLLIPLAGSAYVSVVPPGLASIGLRALVAGLLLIPPTLLMGATLPAIARYVEATPTGVAWMGFFYGGNIAGAVAGCLLAGFVLLRQYDVVIATVAGVVLNLVVAGLGWTLARFDEYKPQAATTDADRPSVRDPRHRIILIGIGLSGLTALGSEVVWTRLMALMLGATTYTFSIILAVFLAALGVGSVVGSHLSRTVRSPRVALGICQFGALLGIGWTAHALSAQLPYWPINPSIAQEPSFVFQLDLARALWALTLAPLFWGASFPLAVAAVAEEGQDPAELMGGVYAANTVGAILGALCFGVIVTPWLGTQGAQRVLVGTAFLSSAILLGPALFRGRPALRLSVGAAGAAAAFWVAVGVGMIPPVLIAYGRFAPTYDAPNALYVGEGRNSSIAVTELNTGILNFHVGGKVVASTEPQDMRLQGMLGHLTALLHEEPKSVLIVGFGAGVTAGTFVTHPSIERIVIAEIEPLITDVSSQYFTSVNNDVLSDPRVEVVHDDARHFLLTTDESFDLITSDPIHPWMKGAAALYSAEYFALAQQHLNPGGVITQWVPFYESTEEAVKSEVVTFFEAFPDGLVFGNTYEGSGYDVVLAAREGGLTIDVDRWVDRLTSGSHGRVAQDLVSVGFNRALDLLTTYAGQADDLRPWLRDAEVNRDRNLRLMYLAGLGLNQYVSGDIYRDMLEYRRFPDELFSGDPNRIAGLRSMMGLSEY